MNTFVIFSAIFAFASAGVVPLAPLTSTTVLEGPSSSASVVGPDGSAIVSTNPAGRIVTSENVGAAIVEHISAPVVHGVAPASYAVVPIAPAAVPVVSAHHAPIVAKALVASPLTASGYPLLAPGSGLEGQWIPDINEKLYDDGSYHGEIY